ncbi:MAG: M48 family metallopeptidase [Deltaproteobacteria bacterium]|nr:M48 family metallopeptidase [Deltaproteobacteria bacterium]
MATVGKLDFAGYVEAQKAKRAGGRARDEHAYAYVSDRNTRWTFERLRPVELAVSAAVRLFKTFGRGELLGKAVKVGPRQFPRVHELVVQSAQSLGIPTPNVYIVNNPVLNAATYGTNEDSFIMVHSGLVDHFDDAELLSVIGHECGHIHNSHVVYLTAMHYLRVMASAFLGWIVVPALLALNGWSRRAEITCDRAGLICSRDLEVSTRALAKLALGSTKLYAELDMDAFLEQHDEGQGSVGRFTEVLATHPWLPKRIKALRVFAQSQIYRDARGEPGGLSIEEVDRRVHEIIKVLG